MANPPLAGERTIPAKPSSGKGAAGVVVSRVHSGDGDHKRKDEADPTSTVLAAVEADPPPLHHASESFHIEISRAWDWAVELADDDKATLRERLGEVTDYLVVVPC